jgi:chemotaxis protein MotA
MNRSLRHSPDLLTIVGFLLGVAGIVGGLILEGGNLADVAQVTAAIIVFGGTLGAVMVTTPGPGMRLACRKLKLVFFAPNRSAEKTIEELILLANKARKSGIMSLESDLPQVSDPFLRKALRMAIDGTDLATVRQIMELQMEHDAEDGIQAARVFESAGGYAPTIGIIGAVLGLIQVMKHLEQIDRIGHGIAVAFVATVYGVGAANLIFLPMAGKIRARTRDTTSAQEMLLEGVCSIAQGLHPKMIYSKLSSWTSSGLSEDPNNRSRLREVA